MTNLPGCAWRRGHGEKGVSREEPTCALFLPEDHLESLRAHALDWKSRPPQRHLSMSVNFDIGRGDPRDRKRRRGLTKIGPREAPLGSRALSL